MQNLDLHTVAVCTNIKGVGIGFYALKQRCLCFLAANLSCLCHPVSFIHQHLPCDVLWTKRNLKPTKETAFLDNETNRSKNFHVGRMQGHEDCDNNIRF